ncbi:MAG TPA: hypothetical protein VD997_05345 [Phycisphaerales bacterium]|nr:hypothetical protein [Phycisphaerales bacterium]
MKDTDAPAPTDAPIIPTGIADLDATLPGGGLARGMTHEWVLDGLDGFGYPATPWRSSGDQGSSEPSVPRKVSRSRRGAAGYPRAGHPNPEVWHPPLLILTYLAARPPGLTVFIGQRCWPCPWTIAKVGLDFSRCLFIDPRPEERAWAIDQALRCPGIGAVVGDVEGMDMADSRRLQLAAEAGQTLGLLTRPAPEIKLLSASGTRWVVSPQPGMSDRVRWKVELRRCKAAALWAAASGGSVREWVLEWDERRRGVQVVTGAPGEVSVDGAGVQEVRREAGGVRVAADVARRSGAAEVRRTA